MSNNHQEIPRFEIEWIIEWKLHLKSGYIVSNEGQIKGKQNLLRDMLKRQCTGFDLSDYLAD